MEKLAEAVHVFKSNAYGPHGQGEAKEPPEIVEAALALRLFFFVRSQMGSLALILISSCERPLLMSFSMFLNCRQRSSASRSSRSSSMMPSL